MWENDQITEKGITFLIDIERKSCILYQYFYFKTLNYPLKVTKITKC